MVTGVFFSMTLSPEQLAALSSASSQNTLVTGLAGTGKSVVAQKLREKYAGTRGLAVTGSTGIAAINIGGVTIHSWSGMGTAEADASTLAKRILYDDKRQKQRANILGCRVLIIDEVSMLSADFIDKLDVVCKVVRKSNKPFGGIRMVFFGDFLQLPPVSKDPKNPARYAFQSEAWQAAEIHVATLTRTFRQADQGFADCLASIRTGTPSEKARAMLNARFRACDDVPEPPPVRLVTHNSTADEINQTHLRDVGGVEWTFRAEDIAEEEGDLDLLKNCIAPAFLTLREGARVMLLANIDQEKGLVNGTTGWVYSLAHDSVGFVSDDSVSLTLKAHKWTVKENEVVIASRSQIPLRLAYAITIHKSQGMTLPKVEAHLGNAFEYGQVYVALSRVKTAEGLFIKSGSKAGIKAHPEALKFYSL